MQLTIHRGTREIGGNCVELAAEETRIVLDVGMPLFQAPGEPFDSNELRRLTTEELQEREILPQVDGLFFEGKSPEAILLSHAHEDHTGLLRHTRPDIPVYAGVGTSKMMLAGSMFALQPELPRQRHRKLIPNEPVTIGEFQITPFLVDHSIFGAMAFLIEAEGKRLLYSGDLRLHGRKPGMQAHLLEQIRKEPIDVLLMEGTHLGHPGKRGRNEYELEEEIVQAISSAPGLVLASFSPQHVDRLVAFLRAAKRTDRTFVADPYTAFILHLLQREGSFPTPETAEWIRVFVPRSFEENPRKSRWEKISFLNPDRGVGISEILTNPEKFVMIFRPSMVRDFAVSFPRGTRCLYSRWEGYLETPEWITLRQKLESNGGNLVTLHTSGHAYREDLIRFVQSVNPRTLIPMHTFQPEAYRESFENVVLLTDGVPFVLP